MQGGMVVEATTYLNIRTDKAVKKCAEAIFSALGLNMTTAVNMFLRKSIQENGIPFDLKLNRPVAMGAMTREQLDAELAKGLADIQAGRVYSVDEVDKMMEEEFGV